MPGLVPTVEPETDKEKEVAGAAGDWLQTVRRKSQPTDNAASADAAPQTPGHAAASSCKAPATPALVPTAAPSTPAPVAACEAEQVEWDLDSLDQCCSWILKCFAPSRKDEIEPLARYCVQQMKTQKGPLSEVFYKQIIAPRLLASNDSRKAWVQSTRYNRSKRYVGAPEAVYKK